MRKRARLMSSVLSAVCLLLAVTACHHDVEKNPYAQISKADMKYQNIQVVNFTIASRGVQETDNPQGVLTESQQAVVQALTDSKLFDSVQSVGTGDKAVPSIIVQGELTRLRIVGGGARFWLGAMAGKSEMSVHVKLTDASTGSIISERDINEDSNPSTGAWTVGATDRVLPLQVGNLIADLVINTAKR